METIKYISELDPGDITVVERLIGHPVDISAKVAIILRVIPGDTSTTSTEELGVPAWCDVLEGMSDDDLADFQHALEMPVRLAHSEG
jgi:hypothetical protein